MQVSLSHFVIGKLPTIASARARPGLLRSEEFRSTARRRDRIIGNDQLIHHVLTDPARAAKLAAAFPEIDRVFTQMTLREHVPGAQLARTDAELSRMLRAGIPFSTSPGTSYEYSNYGFAILGRIVTRVSGMPYAHYVAQNILRPLGM